MNEAVATIEASPDVHSEIYSRTTLGFWIYIMSDCILFSMLFTTYAVLHNNTFGGPSAGELFSLPFALSETMILLASSFTCGLAMLSAKRNDKKGLVAWLIVSLVFGIAFLMLEGHEFNRFIEEGNSWQKSAFLSSYFTLVGTHGLHVTVGSLWMVIVILQILFYGLTSFTFRRLVCLSTFWHFLDVVWIFIFTIVYLMEAK